jgi:hypothetical protein
MYALKEWNKHLIKHVIKSTGILLIELFEIRQYIGYAGYSWEKSQEKN